MKKQNFNDYVEFSNERFTKRVIFKENKTTIFVLNFASGQTLPAHKHPGSNVQLMVMQGEGKFTIDGEDIPVIKGDVLFVEGDEELAFTNNSTSNTSLYVMLNKIPNENYAKDI
ncbi:cupin domain-containing protein [Oceanobacillus halophilus]|uniref:Cupin domain-containing protein n=1 Tax=Oceanobacillus halophilus TaxID=930130 RepID=A0A495A555_9BACI|nr:cupin domain-containing protein [Oceanobacillus halophilus]RKQ34732.1 cupin domain-containing protein [Oceanobacillus halophilus]